MTMGATMEDRDTDVQRGQFDGLLLAAGGGERLGLGPKALLELDGQTLVEWAVSALAGLVARVWVAAPPQRMDEISHLLGARAQVIAGGGSRQDSLWRLLAASGAAGGRPMLLMHDVSHPLAGPALLRAVRDAALAEDVDEALHVAGRPLSSAVLVAPTPAGGPVAVFGRERCHVAGMPQACSRRLLQAARDRAVRLGLSAAGATDLFHATGLPVRVLSWAGDNPKLTTPADWLLVRSMHGARQQPDGTEPCNPSGTC